MIDLPDDITSLNETELNTLISEIRKRRDRPVQAYRAAQALAQSQLEARLLLKVEKELRMFAKTLASVDKKIEELENRAVKITALRLEAGDIHDGSELVYGESEVARP